jgi:hypothetical protein
MLLVSSVPGMSDLMRTSDQSSSEHLLVRQESMGPAQDAVPAPQARKRPGLKISLMMFH